MAPIDGAAVLKGIADADAAFGETLEAAIDAVRAALDTYVEAERQHLGDFTEGRYEQAAAEAWDALVAAREALTSTRGRAEKARQATYAAALETALGSRATAQR